MEATATKTKKKKSKYVFANIPGVPGCTYYLTIKGKRRTLLCTATTGTKVILYALDDGHKFEWDIEHFSYMLRKQRWQDPFVSSVVEKVEVEHTTKKTSAIRTRDYVSGELDSLIDNIDDVNF